MIIRAKVSGTLVPHMGKIVCLGGIALALCTLTASPVRAARLCGEADVSVGDFPRLAGETGDSARIMRAVNSAGYGGVVWFPRGEYAVDEMLSVKNHCSLLLHKSAHLKAVKPMPFVLQYEAAYRGIPGPGELNLFIRGGDFDGAGLAGCVNIAKRWHFRLRDATFRNGRGVGLLFGSKDRPGGCEMEVNNIYCICDMPGLAGNVGLETFVGDSHFTDVIVVDYTTGIRDHLGANRYTRCHVWGGMVQNAAGKREMLENSIAFDLQGTDALLEGCYADTAMVGYNVCREVRIVNCCYLNNWKLCKMDNPVVFRHRAGRLFVTGGRFNKGSPHGTIYRREENAGPLVWEKSNSVLNFTEEECAELAAADGGR